jgi:phosphatidylglycerophosphatase A
MKKFKHIATVFGIGYAPVAPGTAGSMVGIVIIFSVNLLLSILGLAHTAIFILDLVLITGVLFLGQYAIKKVHTIWEHDASKIVIDEVAGVWIAVLFVPLRWEYYLAALLLFRFFDILKPLFIKTIDKMKNSWSVMLDDALAGVYANIALQCIIFFKLF